MTGYRLAIRHSLAALLAIFGAGPALADPLAAALALERGRPPVAAIDRESLLYRTEPKIASATLAPDGRNVAFVRIAGEQRSLWLQSTAPGASSHRILPHVGTGDIAWSPDSRWLFLIDEQTVRMMSVAGMPGSGVIAKLGGASERTLLALDPWVPAALLVDRANGRWRLWRAGAGGSKHLVAYARHEIVDVAIGRDGHAAFAKLVVNGHHLIIARRPDGRFRAVTTCIRLTRCDLLGVTADGHGLYLASDLLGSRRAIVRLDADGRRTLIHDDPAHEVDIDTVILDRKSGVPAIAAYRGDQPMLYGLIKAARIGLAHLSFARDAEVETAPRVWLIRERGDRMQGNRWHLFDPTSGRHRLLLDDRPYRIPASKLVRVIPFSYPASDGMMIHGMLSVPAGRDPAHVPLVTVVHGGPFGHDEIEYNALTQLLANRGYAVFRPQFRGSTGYGRDYMRAARGDFGDGRVQRDIEDGTRFLLARGIGDPRRTAIIGGSFGGYSTLQALSNGSRLYRVGVATVPPTDFGWVTRWAAARTDLGATQGMKFADTLKMLGLDPSDPAVARRLYAQSPRANAAAMRTPLLLIAAGRDERVPIRSVIDYAAHLKLLGAPAQIIVARKQPHSSKDRMAALATLYLVEVMLQRHLDGAPVAPPSRALARWMSANLRCI
jgi:dipeptidyl aminopeptidase/acylaminoacyl peptidase